MFTLLWELIKVNSESCKLNVRFRILQKIDQSPFANFFGKIILEMIKVWHPVLKHALNISNFWILKQKLNGLLSILNDACCYWN